MNSRLQISEDLLILVFQVFKDRIGDQEEEYHLDRVKYLLITFLSIKPKNLLLDFIFYICYFIGSTWTWKSPKLP